MKVAILTMFSGLSATYSLVNVVADQIKMLLQAGVSVKVLVSQSCPDRERTGIFLDERLEWVKITNTLHGKEIVWHDYASPSGSVHETFFEEADKIAADFVTHLKDVDVCILHDILYQGWHLVPTSPFGRPRNRWSTCGFWLSPTPSLWPGPRRWNTPFPPGLPICPRPDLSILPARVSRPWPGSTMCPRADAPWSITPSL